MLLKYPCKRIETQNTQWCGLLLPHVILVVIWARVCDLCMVDAAEYICDDNIHLYTRYFSFSPSTPCPPVALCGLSSVTLALPPPLLVVECVFLTYSRLSSALFSSVLCYNSRKFLCLSIHRKSHTFSRWRVIQPRESCTRSRYSVQNIYVVFVTTQEQRALALIYRSLKTRTSARYQ